MTLRVGIISAAWGAQAHLPAWRAVPGVEVVGICTAHQETAEAAAADARRRPCRSGTRRRWRGIPTST